MTPFRLGLYLVYPRLLTLPHTCSSLADHCTSLIHTRFTRETHACGSVDVILSPGETEGPVATGLVHQHWR